MKRIFLIVLLMLLSTFGLLAQQRASKRPIDNESYKTWKTLGQYNISNDGKYAWYEYGIDEPYERSLVVCSTDGKYKREFPYHTRSAIFTADSRHLIFASPKGLAVIEMGKDTLQYIQYARQHSVPKEGTGQWLSYHKGGDIILKDLISGQERKYSKAKASWFNDQGTAWLVQTPADLLWVSLSDGKEKSILNSISTNNIAFDATGTRIAFITSGSQGNILRYYQPGMDSASVHVTNDSPGIQKGFIITEEVPQFNQDGQRIFFKLAVDIKGSSLQKDSNVITDKVEVWHYKDKYLLSHQLEEVLAESRSRTYTAIVPINAMEVIQLESVDTALVWPLNNKPGSKYILASNIVNDAESYWNKDHIAIFQLISLLDGSSKSIFPELRPVISCALSPGERFVTWYDRKEKNYFSYEVATSVIRNITQTVKAPLFSDHDNLRIHGFPIGIAGWLAGDSTLLVYDQYDIWQIDPLNKKLPVNVTGGYGKRHSTIFRVVGDEFSPITTDTLLLTALNGDKYNGFWKKQQGTSTAPIPCSNMAPLLYYFPGIEFNAQTPPKAKNAGVYLVQRMSATDAPNLFATTDFHSFTPLSDLHPQKEYNWMTSELIRWTMPGGQIGEGILYKPENFDPKKKYPIIFHYYERRSNELFSFKNPALSVGTLNIPWFVSNGYLVCIPNIYYTTGHTGESVVNSVVSVAKYLSMFQWVDGTKMGLQGHSFGGYETNYLVTHSTLFAAAQESAGPSNMIATYGGIAFGGKSTAFQAETGQDGLGTTPWQRPDIYVENSPVFSVDKVQTPLLMMHNKGDGAVPFAHALEMFTALRRLQKPVWLLQYDGQGHILADKNCKLDFTIRQQQFFAHYLKGEPAPVWMVEGIPAKYKGVKSGLGFPINNSKK